MRKKSWKYIVGILLMLAVFTLTACGQTKETEKSGKDDTIKVVTTFYPMYDFAKNVVGDAGDVELLIPAGTEPHDYEPSAKDIAKITDADVFVYNSGELETWVKDILENVDENKVTVVEAAGSIDLMAGVEHDEEEEDDHDGHDHDHELDPHVWLDPVLAQKEVEAIRDALVKKYPEQKEVFEKNSAAYLEKLADLQDIIQSHFETSTLTHEHVVAKIADEFGVVSTNLDVSIANMLAQMEKYNEKVYAQMNNASTMVEKVEQLQTELGKLSEQSTISLSKQLTELKNMNKALLEGISQIADSKSVERQQLLKIQKKLVESFSS